jgi:hypothetical protein
MRTADLLVAIFAVAALEQETHEPELTFNDFLRLEKVVRAART